MFGNRGRPCFDGNALARELKEMPDYSNPETRATEERLGGFYFPPGDEDPIANANLIERGPYELDNGAIYLG